MRQVYRLKRPILAVTVSDPPTLYRLPSGTVLAPRDLPAPPCRANAEVVCTVGGKSLRLFVADLQDFTEKVYVLDNRDKGGEGIDTD